MAVKFDYVAKPICFSYTYPTTVAAASASIPVATFTAPVDCYLDFVGMGVSVNGTSSGATEILLSNNIAGATGDMWATNDLQIAHDSSVLYASLDRGTFNTIGLAKIDAGDRLLLFVTEIPGGTDSTCLTVNILCYAA
jgi:hypothetical protein